MSQSLGRRIAALEAQVPGAVLPDLFRCEPFAASPEVLAAFHADVAAERKRADPRQRIIIFAWAKPKD